MRILALITTCNRKKMLCDLLEDFLDQTRMPDGILVVDNGSEDGTAESVKERFPSVQLIELEHNTGHMGGFEIGVKTAFQHGYDAVLSVDDDARLERNVLECLLRAIDSNQDLRDSLIWCANVTPDSQYFTEPVCLKIWGEWKIYRRFLPELRGKVFESLGGANIGIYIPQSVYEKVGPPMALLAFNGEEEFKYRCRRAGFKGYYCLSSIIHHKMHHFSELNLMGKTRFVSKVPPWHTYYEIRNRIYIDRIYKRRSLMKNLIITVIDSAMKMCISDRKIATAVCISRAIIDGFLGRMGIRVNIPRPKNIV